MEKYIIAEKEIAVVSLKGRSLVCVGELFQRNPKSILKGTRYHGQDHTCTVSTYLFKVFVSFF